MYFLSHLVQNKINAEGIKIFVQNKWPQLESLNFSINFLYKDNNNIEGEGLIYLMGGTLPKLKNLFISKTINQIGECRIKLNKMLKIPTKITNLKKLQISKNNLGNESIKWLIKFNIPYLQTLYICKFWINRLMPNRRSRDQGDE